MEFKYERIRELRKQYGYSLGTACRLLESRCHYRVSRASLWEWEKGRTQPSLKALGALCELYGVEPGYFFE